MGKYNCKTALFILFVLILLNKGSLYAQIDPIATERPTQSIGSLVLPANAFQFEQGFTYTDTLVLDGFFRLALSDLGEIRLLSYYNSPTVTIGAKVNLLKAKDYRPGIAIRVELTGAQVSDYRLAVMQKLTDRFSATFNVGYSTQFYGILALGYSFDNRLGAFFEVYTENNYTQLNTGVTYALNSETQLDVTSGLLDFNSAYISVGFARRFMFKNE